MIKIDFHSCENKEIIFPFFLNVFFNYYPKEIIGAQKKESQIFYQGYKFNFSGFFRDKNTYKYYNCSNNNCTAKIIENQKGYIRLFYDYENKNSKFKNFRQFWRVEFWKNLRKYFRPAIFYNNSILFLLDDNQINILRVFLNKIKFKIYFKDLDSIQILLQSNINLRDLILKKKLNLFITQWFIMKHKQLWDYLIFEVCSIEDEGVIKEIKELYPTTNYILVFFWPKNTNFDFKMEYLSLYNENKINKITKKDNIIYVSNGFVQ
jgi:hypothetical protein